MVRTENMQRLFSGTEWDRPPTCERCGQPESDCACPPAPVEPVRLPPGSQTAHLRLEKRGRGKVVTVVANLDPSGNDLPGLAAHLKTSCGAGGTVKGGKIELQGNHLTAAESALRALGFHSERK